MMYKTTAIAALFAAAARADAVSYTENAECAQAQLMTWYDNDNGLFLYPDGSYYFWQAGVMMSTVAKLAKLDSNVNSSVSSANIWANTYQKGGQNAHGVMQSGNEADPFNPHRVVQSKGEAGRANSVATFRQFRKREQGFISKAYDDEGWWGLAWIDIWDITQNADYLNEAIAIWQDMNAAWNQMTCGGLPWYKGESLSDNPLSIPNELYLSISAHLANRVDPDDKSVYVTAAQDAWNWMQKVKMINSDGLINDGVDASSCTNQGDLSLWTYNQGVILGGLTELSKATGDTSLLDTAAGVANAAITKMVDSNGILADSCDASANCSGDNIQFKGVFAANLAQLYAAQPTDSWKAFLEKNAQALWNNDMQMDGNNCQLGPTWDGPFYTPNASSQSSGLALLVAAMSVQ